MNVPELAAAVQLRERLAALVDELDHHAGTDGPRLLATELLERVDAAVAADRARSLRWELRRRLTAAQTAADEDRFDEVRGFLEQALRALDEVQA